MATKKSKSNKQNPYSELLVQLVEWRKNDPEKYDMAVFALTHEKQSESVSKLLNICPAGSPMEKIVNVFDRCTNIPLELPVYSFVSMLAAYTSRQGVVITSPSAGSRFTDIWNVLLAPSGSSKTFSLNQIRKGGPEGTKPNMTQPAGAAAFIQSWSELENGVAYWVQDEFGQIMHQIDSIGTPLSDVKSMLLIAYGNDKIERTTKGAKKSTVIAVEQPVLNLLGINTYDSFLDSLDNQSMADGFAQRFLFTNCKKDDSKCAGDYAIYDVNKIGAVVDDVWKFVGELTIHKNYHLTDKAEESFKEYFSDFWNDQKVNESFFRRIMYTALKYSLTMHLMQGKNNPEIDESDIGYACRMARLHIDDTAQVICDKMTGSDKIKNQIKTMKSKGIESLDARKVQQTFSGGDLSINAEQSRMILDIAQSTLPKKKKDVFVKEQRNHSFAVYRNEHGVQIGED